MFKLTKVGITKDTDTKAQRHSMHCQDHTTIVVAQPTPW